MAWLDGIITQRRNQFIEQVTDGVTTALYSHVYLGLASKLIHILGAEAPAPKWGLGPGRLIQEIGALNISHLGLIFT